MLLTRRFFLGTAAATAWAAGSKLSQPAGPQFLIAALTMLDHNGRLDDGLVRDYLHFLEQGGADGVLVLGTTGEFPSFSVQERKQILESYLRHKGNLSVMCQVGTPNLPETLDLLAHAASAGADSALVLPPFYFKNPSTEGLAHFYDPVLRASRLPVLLYNIPQLSGVPITAELLHRLSSYERLYGVKDSFNKADVLVERIREFPALHMLTGVPRNIQADLEAGGAGSITGNGSVFARQTAAVFQAWRRHGDVHADQQALDTVAAALSGYDGIPAMKFALSRMGLRESACRPPFAELAPEQKKELAARLTRAGVLAA